MTITKSRKILMEMQGYFQKAGLPILAEHEIKGEDGESDMIFFNSWYKNDSNLAQIKACFFPDHDSAELSMAYYHNFESKEIRILCELLNLLNRSQITGHWIVCTEPNKIEYRSAMIVTEDSLDKEQFEMFLANFLIIGQRFYSLIEEQINCQKKPQELFGQFMVRNTDLFLLD